MKAQSGKTGMGPSGIKKSLGEGTKKSTAYFSNKYGSGKQYNKTTQPVRKAAKAATKKTAAKKRSK